VAPVYSGPSTLGLEPFVRRMVRERRRVPMRSQTIKLGLGLPVLAAILALASMARAADVETAPPVPSAPPESEWTVTFAPYFWAAGINGDVGLFGREPVNVDESFSDIFQDLKFGGMAVAEVHNGTWGLFGDVFYVKTEADASATR